MRFSATAGIVCAALALSIGAATVAGARVAAKTPLAVTLHEESGSGETGTATLADTAKGLVVTLHLDGSNGTQPAHIHAGSCASPEPNPAFRLHDVVGGTSSTTIPKATVGGLAGKYSINVHRSTTDFAYVSCGEVAR